MVGNGVQATSRNGLERTVPIVSGLSTAIIPGLLAPGRYAIALIVICLLGLGAVTSFSRPERAQWFALGLSASVVLAFLTAGQTGIATLTMVLAIGAPIYFRERGKRQTKNTPGQLSSPRLQLEEHRRAVWFVSGLLGSIALGEFCAGQRGLSIVIILVVGIGALTYFRREQNILAEGLATDRRTDTLDAAQHLERQHPSERLRSEQVIDAEQIAAQQELDLLASHSTLRAIRSLTGLELELHVAAFYRKKGYITTLTPATGDQGADVIARNAAESIAIQCKRWEASVGNDAVQEALGAIFWYKCSRAVVIASSDFTKSAIALADVAGVELVNGFEYAERVRRLGSS